MPRPFSQAQQHWQSVRVPHDFVNEGVFNSSADRLHGYLPRGVGWYQRELVLPAASGADGAAWLHFEGAYRDTEVYVDGKLLAHHTSGYTPFSVPLPSSRPPGAKMQIAVRCDATLGEGWFYEGGGIYRSVRLITTREAAAYLTQDGVFVSSQVQAGDIHCVAGTDQGGGGHCSATSATLTIQAEVSSSSGSSSSDATTGTAVHLEHTVLDAHGRSVGVATSAALQPPLVGGAAAVSRVEVVLQKNVSLWSVDSPALYTLRTVLVHSGSPVDTVSTSFGVRTLRYEASSGFFLNGVHVELRGVASHQDFGGVGTAVPDTLQDFRVAAIKRMGGNAWRCAHNPPSPGFMRSCDRLGMLVMMENRRFGPGDNYDKVAPAPPLTTPEIMTDAVAMVRTHRNRASVIMYSLCNELGCFVDTNTSSQGATVAALTKTAIWQQDSTRPVTAAVNQGVGSGPGFGIQAVVDILGVNYQYGQWDAWHTNHPLQPMFISETAACTCARGTYRTVTNASVVHQSQWNCLDGGCLGGATLEELWADVYKSKYISGGFFWSGFDYRGEPSLIGSEAGTWPAVTSSWGPSCIVPL